MDASTWAMFLAMAARSMILCSTMLAVGALTTKQPCLVASARSTLLIPTLALPTTSNLARPDPHYRFRSRGLKDLAWDLGATVHDEGVVEQDLVNVYHVGFEDAKSLLDEHELNQVKEQDQENLRWGLSKFVKRISIWLL